MALGSRPLASRPLASNEVSSTNTTLSIPAASVVLTDQLPALQSTLAVPAASVVLTSQAPTLQVGTNLTAPAASVVLTAFAPALQQSLAMPVASIVLSSQAPTVTGGTVAPTTGSVMSGGGGGGSHRGGHSGGRNMRWDEPIPRVVKRKRITPDAVEPVEPTPTIEPDAVELPVVQPEMTAAQRFLQEAIQRTVETRRGEMEAARVATELLARQAREALEREADDEDVLLLMA